MSVCVWGGCVWGLDLECDLIFDQAFILKEVLTNCYHLGKYITTLRMPGVLLICDMCYLPSCKIGQVTLKV